MWVLESPGKVLGFFVSKIGNPVNHINRTITGNYFDCALVTIILNHVLFLVFMLWIAVGKR